MFVTAVTSERCRLTEEIRSVGADPYAVRMWERGEPLSVKVSAVSAFVANVIKQEALASGIDAAVNRGAANCSVEKSDLLIIGNVRGMKILTHRLKKQGGVLEAIANEIACELEGLISSAEGMYTLRFRDRVLTFKNLIMGILNVTPDSFSDGGRYDTPGRVKDRLKKIFDEGALIADIGGVSTRPGYTPVDASEEERRVLPAAEEALRIASDYGGFISIDTSTPSVAEKALALGVDMINDQLALETPGMAEICARYRAAVVLMHNAENMTDDIPQAMAEVKDYLARAAERAVGIGIDRESVVLDPGFGFGKSLKIQYTILKYFRELCSLAYPVLAGISRKSMLGVISGRAAADRDYLTAAAETAAALSGASIVRTHNVAAARDVFSVAAALEVGK
jgi:dihydropteroate synthase